MLTAGTQTLSVTLNPTDSTDYTTATQTVSLTVSKAPVTIVSASSLSPSLYGDMVTFTFTVTGSGVTPTGTLTVADGGTTLATVSISSGSATYSTSTFLAGLHALTATYGGDSNYY
jgi:hypothetical protein